MMPWFLHSQLTFQDQDCYYQKLAFLSAAWKVNLLEILAVAQSLHLHVGNKSFSGAPAWEQHSWETKTWIRSKCWESAVLF